MSELVGQCKCRLITNNNRSSGQYDRTRNDADSIRLVIRRLPIQQFSERAFGTVLLSRTVLAPCVLVSVLVSISIFFQCLWVQLDRYELVRQLLRNI